MTEINKLKEYLLRSVSRNSIDQLKLSVKNKDILLSNLLKLSNHNNKKVAWRAAWTFENCLSSKEDARPYLNEIIESLKLDASNGQKRHALKVIMMFDPSEYDYGKLVDFCFTLLLKSDESIAVKANAMTILYDVSVYEPLILNELKDSIDLVLEDASKGLKSRGNKILKNINKRI